MQHQPHEAFFSFTVPPKPVSLHPHPPPSSVPLSSYHHHPASLLSSIVTDLDRPTQPSPHLDFSCRSPSSASPTGTFINRPNTAGPFAFNVPSVTSSTTPSSTATRFSPNHPPTSASSVATSVERPFSSSGLHIINSSLPAPISNTQAPCSSNHVISNDAHQSSARSNHAHLTSRSSQPSQPSPLPAPTHMSHHAINLQSARPMTAPGPSWVGAHHLADSFEFPSAHVGLFAQASSYPPHHDSLDGSLLPKPSSQLVSSNTTHVINSSPGPSNLMAGPVEPLGQALPGSSSASSNSQARPHASHSLEPLDCSDQVTSPIRCRSGPGRASLGGRSSDSAPESPDSSDADLIHPHGYLHALTSDHLRQALRPSTHSGTSASFGHGDRCISQNIHPRPTTGYPHIYDLSGSYASTNAIGNSYLHRPSVFAGHNSHVYTTSPGQYSHGPGSMESSGHERLYNFNILPGAPRKRARRRFDEVERLYDCNYPGCTKAYGTLNHLNAHITMQKHGPKRLPQEFKEIRKEWRARKKAEAEARALAMKQSVSHVPCHEYSILGGPEAFRQHNSGVSNDSSPSGSSTGGGLSHHLRSPAVRGPYSAPPHSQQFPLSDPHSDWYSPDHHRINSTIIDEQPEYLGSVSSHDSNASLLPPQVSGSPSGAGSISHSDQPLYPSHSALGHPLSQVNRSNPLILNRPSSLVE